MRTLLFLAAASFCLPVSAADWPAWRGPNGDGISPETKFPTSWSATRNVRWRVDLPDRGNATPIVAAGRVFVPQAIEADGRRLLLAFDRATGAKLWEAGTRFEGKEETHEANPYCAGSPVTDGDRVVVSFGSAGVFAYDLAGKELWRRDLGPQRHTWGNASSPVLHGPHVLLYHGPGPHARLVALDRQTGAIAWEHRLPEPVPTVRTDGFRGQAPGVVGSFATPILVRAGGRTEVVLSLPEVVRAWDPATGLELWHCAGLNPLVYLTPTFGEGLVFAAGGYFGSALAVRPGGEGDVTATHRVWHEERNRKGRLGSGVIQDGHVFLVNMDGMAECLELKTGRQVWLERLDGPGAANDTWSSMTLAGDLIYAVNQSGEVFVLRAAPKFELLATNSVGEHTNSSLAMSDGELFLRTWKGLWCLSTEGAKVAARE